MADEKKKKIDYSSAWAEARRIIWGARWRLLLGSVLMLVSRLSGMVLPASTKFIGDEIFINQRYELLKWIALAIGVSTLVQGVTGFALSQILGVAAQLASAATGALGAAKRLLHSGFSETLETQMELESQAIAARARTADGQEGISAFLEKRAAKFSNK